MKPANLILYVLLILLIINCGQPNYGNDPYVIPKADDVLRTGYVNLVLVHSETGNPIANSRVHTTYGDSTTNAMGELFLSQSMRVPRDYSDIYYNHPINFQAYRFIAIDDSILWAFSIDDTKTYTYDLIPGECYYYAIIILTNSETGQPISNVTFEASEFYDDHATTDDEGRMEPVLRIPRPDPESPCPDVAQITIWAWREGYDETGINIVGTSKPEDANTYHVAVNPYP